MARATHGVAPAILSGGAARCPPQQGRAPAERRPRAASCGFGPPPLCGACSVLAAAAVLRRRRQRGGRLAATLAAAEPRRHRSGRSSRRAKPGKDPAELDFATRLWQDPNERQEVKISPSPFGELPGSKALRSLFMRPIVDLVVILAVFVGIIAFALNTIIEDPVISNCIGNVETGIQSIFLLEFLLRWYGRNLRPSYLLNTQMVIDGLSFVPLLSAALGSGFGPAGEGNFALSFLRLLRILRLQRFLKSRETLTPILSLFGLVGPKGATEFQLQLAQTLTTVVTILFVSASLVYTCEHPTNPSFPNFFVALYFVLTTLTTVGFGDIVPITPEGRLTVSFSILFGVTLIPLALGRLAEAASSLDDDSSHEDADEFSTECATDSTSAIATSPAAGAARWPCGRCGEEWHNPEANFCFRCGAPLRLPQGETASSPGLRGRFRRALREISGTARERDSKEPSTGVGEVVEIEAKTR